MNLLIEAVRQVGRTAVNRGADGARSLSSEINSCILERGPRETSQRAAGVERGGGASGNS